MYRLLHPEKNIFNYQKRDYLERTVIENTIFSFENKITVADKVYTVSSATDHYREQSRSGAFGFQRCPDYANFYSSLPHYPNTTIRLKGTDNVPHFISRDHAPERPCKQDLASRSEHATVSGPFRHKYSQAPSLNAHTPLIVVRAPVSPMNAVRLPPLSHSAAEATRTFGTQSDMRESDVQTDPYSPEFIIPAVSSLQQQMLSRQHNCDGPEIAYLQVLTSGLNHPGNY